MRLDVDKNTLVLSERNLLTLLTKLYTEGSTRKLQGGEDCPMSVRAEPDEVHYGQREYGPGPMHPTTERIMAAVREATQGVDLIPVNHPSEIPAFTSEDEESKFWATHEITDELWDKLSSEDTPGNGMV